MIKKILLGIVALIVLAAATFYLYVTLSWDKKYDIAYPELKSSTDSLVIARGKYLVEGPAHCVGCHQATFHDLILADQGQELPLQGGVDFAMGPLGHMFPANLTPDPATGIGRYTDGEVFRMMRHAVKPDGTATLGLLMPFWNMADEDLIAIVSYLRSMKAVEHQVGPPQWTFMGKAIRVLTPMFRPIETPTPPDNAPPMAATIERGEYLARYVANCVGCHTERDPMTYEAIGPEFAGGMEFEPFPELHRELGVDEDLWSRSPNLTPSANSVLSKFPTVDDWIKRFRMGRTVPHSPMDWGPFSKMSDEDLEALYLFMHSLDAVDKTIAETVFKKD